MLSPALVYAGGDFFILFLPLQQKVFAGFFLPKEHYLPSHFKQPFNNKSVCTCNAREKCKKFRLPRKMKRDSKGNSDEKELEILCSHREGMGKLLPKREPKVAPAFMFADWAGHLGTQTVGQAFSSLSINVTILQFRSGSFSLGLSEELKRAGHPTASEIQVQFNEG